MFKTLINKFTKKQLTFYIILAILTIIAIFVPERFLAFLKSPLGLIILALWSFCSAFIFAVPVDFYIVFIALQSSSWLLIAVFATTFSLLGALFTHFLGAKYKFKIARKIYSEKEIIKSENKIKEWSALSILISIFTRTPFRTVVYLSGVYKINIREIIVYTIIGHLLRYSIVAYIITEIASSTIFKNNLGLVIIAAICFGLIGGLIWTILVKKEPRK